ncbi:hypothetical protein [Parafrankia soli]|uniref:hypothetical protein n=1 Tax=Parafrankia soli TaxID=2599596 RepID=UPI0034D797A8
MSRHDPALARALAVACRQKGALTRVQARCAGLTDHRLHQLVQNEDWLNPVQGGYVVPTCDTYLGRCQAALLVLPCATLCGLTAARLHEFPTLPPCSDDEPIHLLLPPGSSRRRNKGVVLWYDAMSAEQQEQVQGLRATSAARTLVDLLASGSRDTAASLLDHAAEGGLVAPEELDELRGALDTQPEATRPDPVRPDT